MGRLDGKRAVITGAASGIGEGTARLFVAEGATVVLADMDEQRGKRLADELGERTRFVATDVAREGDVARAIEVSVADFGGLDVMFNNAGVPGSVGGILDIDVATWDRTIAVHLRGVFLGIQAAARVMRPQGHGSIINTSSVAASRANMAGHDYSAAKAAITHLTHTTANELGEDGIRVNAVCPGAIATSIFGRAAGLSSEEAQRTVDFMAAVLSEAAPIRRVGRPADIAELVLWLASDASSYVNGQAIAVDGGLLTGSLRRNAPLARGDGLAMIREAARQSPGSSARAVDGGGSARDPDQRRP